MVHRAAAETEVLMYESVGSFISTPPLVVQLDSWNPVLRGRGIIRGDAHSGGEVHSEAEGFAFVVLVGSPLHPERSHAIEELITKGWETNRFLAVEHVDRS
jgi:hypothetical protein